MKCDRYGLVRYIHGEMDVGEMEKMTAHLEQCADCSAELKLIARLRANREELRHALQGCAARAKPAPFVSSGRWETVRSGIRKNPYAWIAAASLLVALGAVWFYLVRTTQAEDVALLATTGLPPYEPMILRQEDLPVKPQFAAAMDSYRKGDLVPAETSLEQHLQTNPDDAETLFYLGVIRYYRQEYTDAQRLIRRGLDHCSYCPRERYHWYLAQIALKCRQKEEARRELRQVVEFQGSYAAEAAQILSRLP